MSKTFIAMIVATVAAVSLVSCGGGSSNVSESDDDAAAVPGTARAVAAQPLSAAGRRGATASTAELPDDTYVLRNACSGKVLDVQAASQEPAATVLLWDWWGGANQQWQLQRQADDGSYRLQAMHSGQVLDVSGSGAGEWISVIQYPWHGGSNQRWLPQSQGNGLWILQARHSGKVLDVRSSSNANGAPVKQHSGNDGCAQRWKIEPVSAPAPAPTAFDGVTLHLDPQSPQANDSNDGSEAAPLKTIVGALKLAAPLREQGRKVRILFYPGVYRDYLISGGGQDGETPPWPFWNLPDNATELVLEAKEPGRAIISGADIWTGWRNLGNGRWAREWPFDWGAPRAGETLGGGPVVSETAARRELISVDGRRLTQVLREQDLRPGTFRVDEAANQIVIAAESNTDLNASTVEVGVRSQLFYVWNRGHITLRGLVFTHSVDRFFEHAVAFQVGQGGTCSDVLLDNVRIVGNGQGGFESYCNKVEMRNNAVSDNGYAGIIGAYASGWRLDGNTTDGNGWRAWAGGYKGWATAGVKVLVMQDFVAKRHRAVGNLATGFWLDTQNSDVLLEDSVIANNLWDGLFLEASAGPFTVRNNLICGNGLSDLLLGAVAKVTLEGNRILSTAAVNAELPSQSTAIFFGETRRIEPGQSNGGVGITPSEYPLREITIKGNVVRAEGAGRSLTGNYWYFADSTRPDAAQVRADHEVFMRTLVSDNNTWFADEPKPFSITAVATGYGEAFDFAGWRAVTAQDKNSTFAKTDAGCNP
jgi:Ricin-type beta-trefoil lectin domain-like/Right handed beta helix region